MTEIERRDFLKNAGAALAGVAGVSVLTSAGCNRQNFAGKVRNPTREALVKRLEKLAQSEPSNPTMGGANCYVSAMPPIVKKTCSDCEQTMIVGEKDEILREYNVPLKRIQDQKLNAELIIPKHCVQCGFGLKEEKFQLEIKYPDHPDAVRVELESAFDLELMVFFLLGKERYKQVHKFGGEHEGPLKHRVERLRELFGVKD